MDHSFFRWSCVLSLPHSAAHVGKFIGHIVRMSQQRYFSKFFVIIPYEWTKVKVGY
jgi:hypothetical protein